MGTEGGRGSCYAKDLLAEAKGRFVSQAFRWALSNMIVPAMALRRVALLQLAAAGGGGGTGFAWRSLRAQASLAALEAAVAGPTPGTDHPGMPAACQHLATQLAELRAEIAALGGPQPPSEAALCQRAMQVVGCAFEVAYLVAEPSYEDVELLRLAVAEGCHVLR